MGPEILQGNSIWDNLWLISIAIFIATWALIITAAVTAAAVIPYLTVRMMTARMTAVRTKAGPGRPRAAGRINRKLLLAAAAVIILMAAAVTGLAYGVGAAKHHHPSSSKNIKPGSAARLEPHPKTTRDDGTIRAPGAGTDPGWLKAEPPGRTWQFRYTQTQGHWSKPRRNGDEPVLVWTLPEKPSPTPRRGDEPPTPPVQKGRRTPTPHGGD